MTKRGALKTDPLANITANSGPFRRHTISDDPLPPSCQPILDPGSNIPLDALCSNFPQEPFMRNFIEGLLEVQKDYIYGPRTVTLTEHVLVKVKDVCNTRPALKKTVLARVDKVNSLQEIDLPVLPQNTRSRYSRPSCPCLQEIDLPLLPQADWSVAPVYP